MYNMNFIVTELSVINVFLRDVVVELLFFFEKILVYRGLVLIFFVSLHNNCLFAIIWFKILYIYLKISVFESFFKK